MTADPRCSAVPRHGRTPAPPWLATAAHSSRGPARHRSTGGLRIPAQRVAEIPPGLLPTALPVAADEPPAGLGPWVPPLPDPGRQLGHRGVVGLLAATLLMIAGIAFAGTYALRVSPVPGSDANFLAGVRAHSTLTSGTASDATLLAAGATVCPGLDRRPSLPGLIGVLDTVRTSTGWSTDDSGAVVASAVGAYCPQRLGLLGT